MARIWREYSAKTITDIYEVGFLGSPEAMGAWLGWLTANDKMEAESIVLRSTFRWMDGGYDAIELVGFHAGEEFCRAYAAYGEGDVEITVKYNGVRFWVNPKHIKDGVGSWGEMELVFGIDGKYDLAWDLPEVCLDELAEALGLRESGK